MSLKILYDMEQLIGARGKGTGVVRASGKILKGLNGYPEIQMHPLITKTKKGLSEYLRKAGLESLENQKELLPMLRSSTNKKTVFHRLSSKLLVKLLKNSYGKKLASYDWYFSIFSPISPIVYESGIKTALFVHDLIPVVHPEHSSAWFVKKYTQWIRDIQADVIFVNSEATKKDLLASRPDIRAERIILPSLAADKKFHKVTDAEVLRKVRQKYGIGDAKYFLGVSELSTRKNLVHLMNSFVDFLDKTKAQDIKLVLVGPMRKGYTDITQTIKGLDKYKDKIVLTGFVDDDDMAAVYSGALCFVYPSLYEGFGLPILEAMQCGVPVISADNSSLPEVGADAALYISGKQTEQTAQALEKIYSDETFRSLLSQKGLKRASMFSWQKTVDTIFNTLKNFERK
jgi:glycosyltransferase involved in cell wall biosynthesis